MPPQIPPAGSNTVTAKDGTPLNPLAVNLAKAIRQQESGGDYNAVGDLDRGVSKGAYQFNRDNFQTWAKEQNLDPNDFSPTNQDKVAYGRINKMLQEGSSPSEVAARWNGSKIVNGKYEAINPQYVESVKQHYATVVGGGNPSQNVASVAQSVPQKTIAGTPVAQAAGVEPEKKDNRNLLQKGVDFAFPIVGDIGNIIKGKNEKTGLQLAGDAALSALWFIPGVGAGAGLTAKLGGGLLGKLGARALEGAATGYTADVGSKLAEGKSVAGSLKPGAGTFVGAAGGPILGKIGDKVSSKFTQEGALSSIQKNIEKTLVANKPGRRLVNTAKSQGHNPAELIAKSGAVPDVIDGKFVTVPQQEYLQGRIGQLGEARAEALDAMGTRIGLNELRDEALAASRDPYIIASGQSGKIKSQINRIFDDFKRNFGEDMSVSDLEKIKEAQAKASGIYKRTGQIGEDNASSIIGDISRKKIEDIADKSGFGGMQEFNHYIASHYKALDALKAIEGQPVKGGRLGNMLRGHAAGTAAAMVGSTAGGPMAGAAGFLATEAANKVLSKILGDTALSNPLKDAILKRIEMANPGIVEKLQQFSGTQGKKVAPLLTPNKGKAGGLLPSLGTAYATRVATPGTNQ